MLSRQYSVGVLLMKHSTLSHTQHKKRIPTQIPVFRLKPSHQSITSKYKLKPNKKTTMYSMMCQKLTTTMSTIYYSHLQLLFLLTCSVHKLQCIIINIVQYLSITCTHSLPHKRLIKSHEKKCMPSESVTLICNISVNLMEHLRWKQL